MRIGSLFSHDQVHQFAHSLPIALARFAGLAFPDPVAALAPVAARG